MGKKLGVGFIGAGPATQAIHLPVMAGFRDRLEVVHVMDVDRHVAEAVATRTGARASAEVASVLDDAAVDIVVVCSPHWFHAEQVIAAAAAGKKAVLCEKPLATTFTEARQLADATRAAGTIVVVGAMHTYDPACSAAFEQIQGCQRPPAMVRSTIYLPTNDVFVGLATELVAPPTPAGATASGTEQERRVASVRAGVLGLTIHDLPLVRRLQPSFKKVSFASTVEPWGYLLVLSSPEQVAELTALMPGEWGPSWQFWATGADYELSINFPPSYVMAGSAVARLTSRVGIKEWHFNDNGYQVEWRHLIDAVSGAAPPPFSIDDVVDDMTYALDVAEGASHYLSRQDGEEI